MKLKITYDENTCIGTVNCVSMAANYFKEDENEYTILEGGVKNEETGMIELEVDVDEETAAKLRLAESGCPVKAIEVTEI